MKKLFCFLLCVLLVFGMTACTFVKIPEIQLPDIKGEENKEEEKKPDTSEEESDGEKEEEQNASPDEKQEEDQTEKESFSEPSEPDTPVVSGPENVNVREFAAEMEGIWVLDAEEVELSFTFAAFDNGWFYTAAYPGGIDPAGEIMQVVRDGDSYTLTLRYPAGDYYGEYTEEEISEVTLCMKDRKLWDEEYPDQIWTYSGKTLDEAIERFGIEW